MSKVIKYGDNVDTDVIIPARYLNISDKKALAVHCMEDLDPDFHKKVKRGDILVAGKNFGCGSSREHAPLVIKESGISLIIAQSFARIFYRNAINIGLPIIESADAAGEICESDDVTADFAAGVLENKTQNKRYAVPPFPPFIRNIMDCGGLAELVKSGGF